MVSLEDVLKAQSDVSYAPRHVSPMMTQSESTLSTTVLKVPETSEISEVPEVSVMSEANMTLGVPEVSVRPEANMSFDVSEMSEVSVRPETNMTLDTLRDRYTSQKELKMAVLEHSYNQGSRCQLLRGKKHGGKKKVFVCSSNVGNQENAVPCHYK